MSRRRRGVIAVPDALTSITTSAPLTYPNGDKVQYLEFCFRCRAVGGTARVNDSELAEVGWYSLPRCRTWSPSTSGR